MGKILNRGPAPLGKMVENIDGSETKINMISQVPAWYQFKAVQHARLKMLLGII